MKLAIEGIGVVGGFGQGCADLVTGLNNGGVEAQQVSVERSCGTDVFPAYRATVDGVYEFFPKRALRRIDHFSKMSLLGACLALQDAGLMESDLSRTGVVIATGYGAMKTTFEFLDSYLDFGYSCSSPIHFSNSVHNAAAGHVSMQLKVPAPSMTVTQFEMSVPSALLTAKLWLAEGRVDRVLLGCVDEYCDVLRYCWKQFFGDNTPKALQPLDFTKQSAVVGEGAAFLVLSRAEADAPYACIEAVELGNHEVFPVALPAADHLILGADGHKSCAQYYRQLGLNDRQVAAYASLYGSFPAAAGFDLAVAALALRDGRFYLGNRVDGGVSQADALTLTPADRISCLKFGPGGDYGLVRLVR